MTGTTTVWLLCYPVELGVSTVEHVEDWVRGSALIALGRDGGTSTHDVPVRLQQMVDMPTRRYASELSEPDHVRAAAAARGQPTVGEPPQPWTPRPTVAAVPAVG